MFLKIEKGRESIMKEYERLYSQFIWIVFRRVPSKIEKGYIGQHVLQEEIL